MTEADRLSEQDIAALNQLKQDWARHCLNGDWDALVALLADDVVLLPPAQSVVEGKAAARRWLEEFPVIVAFALHVDDTDGRGDFAWARGRFEMTVEHPPAQRVPVAGKWSATYRKSPDGIWLCTSDTWNLNQATPAG